MNISIPQGIPLQNTTPSGKQPTRRVEDAAQAQQIYALLWDANKARNLEQAAYQGQINGNPPYNPSALRRVGRAGDANFNTLEAKALVSTAMVPYYDLFSGGNRYVEVMLDQGDEWQNTYASGIVSEEWDETLKRWRNFEFVMDRLIFDYVVFGKGFLVPGKNGSWRYQSVKQYRTMVPDATPIDIEELEVVCMIQNFTVTYLQDKIRDAEAARNMGWDIEETRDAIRSAVPVDAAIPNDPMAVQNTIKEADIYVAARNATVQCATIYVKEFNGKWTEMIVRRDQVAGSNQTGTYPGTSEKQPPRFIFKKEDKYSTVQEFLVPFFFAAGESEWNGASGIGKDIFVPCQLSDRTWCSKVDSMFLRNSIIIQPRTESDRQKLNVMQLGKLTVIPSGVEAKDSTILGDITSTIEVGRELSMMIEKNTGIYRPTLDKGGGNPDTLGEFQTKFAQATALSTSAITRFYSQLDRLYEEMFKLLVKAGSTGTWKESNDNKDDWENEARRFVKRCEDRGVTKEMLKRPRWVRAFRAIGQGSAAMRQQIVATFVSPNVFPLLPPDGQQNALEDFVRTLGGQTAVNRYMPATSRMNLPDSNQWEAMIENASMKIGAPVTWTPRQNNIIHAEVHLVAAAQAIQSLNQGADPMDVLAYVDFIGGHVAEHLERESAKPTSQAAVKALQQRWKQLAGVADQIRSQIEATQEQQAELAQRQQEIITESQVKMMETEAKLAQSERKMQGTLALKEQRQNAELALKERQILADAAMSDAANAADITRKTAKTQAEIDAQAAKAAATEKQPDNKA